ncbi:DEAH (Asp-Glu-Ala-His) box polypeptide 34 [Nowakowskiella sp. JEL0078]|nr:DEAH (Asp-Glu-Ala-His) box polypeptide 34 [Nowakowskiella sp. JEL0078]
MLTKRDLNVLKLIICAGLYPHLAFSDEANYAKRPTEQVFHTKTKRFVMMHPTSVFTYKPELLNEQQIGTTPVFGQTSSKEDETLETIQEQRPKITELLCFVELMETNKPYLMNVLRVPALPGCLLFARSIDLTPDLQHVLVDGWLHLHFRNPKKSSDILVLANWLRCGWELVVDCKLRSVQHDFVFRPHNQNKNDDDDDELEESVPTMLFGTALAVPEKNIEREETKIQIASGKKELNWEQYHWNEIEFLPGAVRQIRTDWIDSVLRGGKGTFEDIGAEDVFDRLGDFLDDGGECSVERLRVLDVKKLFGYEPYKPENSQAGLRITPNLRYFVKDPVEIAQLPRLTRRRFELPDVSTWEINVEVESKESKTKETVPNKPKEIRDESSLSRVKRSSFTCLVCGMVLNVSPVEKLRHIKTCGKEF